MCCLLVSDILCEELGGGDGGRRSKAVPRSPLHGCFILHWVKERVRVYGASCEWAGHWCALSGRVRERTPGSRRSAYRLHLSTNISPSKKKKRIKRAGQNPKKEQIDRLEKISAPNFEGPQWARITDSVTSHWRDPHRLQRCAPGCCCWSPGCSGSVCERSFYNFSMHHIHLSVTLDVGKSAQSACPDDIQLSFIENI